MVQTHDLMSKIQMRGCFEKEYLLGHDKYGSIMYSNNQGDPLGNSSNKDMHHERIRMKETQKYLVERCYYHIECIATTFLATFMWRRLLNNIVLATITHRRSKRVSDGTDTQVRA